MRAMQLMARLAPISAIVVVASALLPLACATTPAAPSGSVAAPAAGASGYAGASVKRGGQLYDAWWETAGVADAKKPDTNPGYAKTTGTQKGASTWRCKECHGWDYKGKDGVYAKGSHVTGSKGIFDARAKAPDDLFAKIKDGIPSTAMSAYRTHLSDADIWDLVKFIKEGTMDVTPLVDAKDKAVNGDAKNGATRFGAVCSSCHGADGKLQNFGDAKEPEYVGTVANENPWEFIHKVRFGQPGKEMPSSIADSKWNDKDVLDALFHAQTLPTK